MVHGSPQDDVADTASEPVDDLVSLLTETANGNRKAFADLYARTCGRLLAIAHKMTGERALAEEVLQEAFLTIWQKAGLYSPNLGAPMAWMTTLVRHKAIDRLRLVGGSREIAIGTDIELDEMASSIPRRGEGQLVEAQSILRCLEKLKDKQQKFIVLAFYKGLTHQELSLETDTPLGTVKSDLRRGLSDLKVCLEQ